MPRPDLPTTIRGEPGNFLLFQAVPECPSPGRTLFQLPHFYRMHLKTAFKGVFY